MITAPQLDAFVRYQPRLYYTNWCRARKLTIGLPSVKAYCRDYCIDYAPLEAMLKARAPRYRIAVLKGVATQAVLDKTFYSQFSKAELRALPTYAQAPIGGQYACDWLLWSTAMRELTLDAMDQRLGKANWVLSILASLGKKPPIGWLKAETIEQLELLQGATNGTESNIADR